MELNITNNGSKVRVAVSGKIDEQGAEELKNRFRALKPEGLTEAVFDFSGVTHIGSAGIGKLLLFYKDMTSHNGEIRIENTPGPILELLRLVKMDTIFPVS